MDSDSWESFNKNRQELVQLLDPFQDVLLMADGVAGVLGQRVQEHVVSEHKEGLEVATTRHRVMVVRPVMGL